MHKGRKPCGNHRCMWPTTMTINDDTAQHGGPIPANRLTKSCNVGLWCTYLILDILVLKHTIRHLLKQAICLPVLHDLIAGTGLELIKVTFF